jgi:hypothetical protein
MDFGIYSRSFSVSIGATSIDCVVEDILRELRPTETPLLLDTSESTAVCR